MLKNPSSRLSRVSMQLAMALTLALCAHVSVAQEAANAIARTRIQGLLNEKEARTHAQRKLGSQLWYTVQRAKGQQLADIPEVYAAAADSVGVDEAGRAKLKLRATVSDALLSKITSVGGSVFFASRAERTLVAMVPISAVEMLAADPEVDQINPASRGHTNVGAVTTQGYVAHRANRAIASGVDGTGVRVGVLSDSADAASIAALISSGDLPADTVVLPGQSGENITGHSNEGSAMLEIVHDLAPGAKLFFASASSSEDNFAENIRTLRNVYHCDVIVDDYTYFYEGAFQDTTVAQAVNAVTADGAIYFSSAANSGNLSSGTSGTWEGDFQAGGVPGAPVSQYGSYTVHAFAPGQNFDVLKSGTNSVLVHWSDPSGASTNDYDLFVLDAEGATVLCAATSVQSGNGWDPIEGCYSGDGFPAGSRIVVAMKAGAEVRALHVDTERGALTIGTSGATFGHNAGANSVTIAATYWNSARTGVRPFVGGKSNPVELFSSDGPRRIFYQPDGTPITPGNYLFSTNGGLVLQKPDFAAADGVQTKTAGFLPFFGTSAAAPHAAAIAALVKSARPDYTTAQILNAMKMTALDIMAPGADRDSGAGLPMADDAVNFAKSH